MSALTPGHGKPAAQLRAEETAVFDSQPVTTRCMFCHWEWHGTAGEARTIALEHRETHHPGLRSARRRAHRSRFNPGMLMRPEDLLEVERDRYRRARLHGVHLEE